MIMIAQGIGISVDRDFLLKVACYEREALRILGEKLDKDKDDGVCNSHKKDECRIIFGDYFEWACKNCEEMKDGRAGSKAKNIN